ncbi:hypothetical protein NPIL_161781 [Nephila pilipes]|uniref:Uncharacterized protein n=1 Tax=Nephila pilipes TaxID=299642 RepID=A0A8X6N658_NEPPI|nr:hypothetical protein NPIL_161781 [Nephila pilipes]
MSDQKRLESLSTPEEKGWDLKESETTENTDSDDIRQRDFHRRYQEVESSQAKAASKEPERALPSCDQKTDDRRTSRYQD